jgi:two-component system, chemotaxis family, chemotaxis protein CheY
MLGRLTMILLVEDDNDISESISEILTSEGFDVVRARNGKEGLDMLRSHDGTRLILLDLMMPVMDGFEFQAAISRQPGYAGIPIIVMSADGHVREKKAQVCAVEYLRKPVDIDVLIDTVRKHA